MFGRDEPRSPDDQWFADAAVVQQSLMTAERPRGTGSRLWTIVAGDDHHRVIAELRILAEVIEERSQLIVHILQDTRIHRLSTAVTTKFQWRFERRVDIVGPDI